jgi:hypothetical protein
MAAQPVRVVRAPTQYSEDQLLNFAERNDIAIVNKGCEPFEGNKFDGTKSFFFSMTTSQSRKIQLEISRHAYPWCAPFKPLNTVWRNYNSQSRRTSRGYVCINLSHELHHPRSICRSFYEPRGVSLVVTLELLIRIHVGYLSTDFFHSGRPAAAAAVPFTVGIRR